jgi:cytochrome c oxidase subunit 3
MSHAPSAHLQHHFDDPVQQFDSGKLGMWLFLATEILLFGGLFCAYAVYRANHPEIFVYAHTFLNKNLGAVNTVILLCSSLTMAWAVRAAQLGQRRVLVALLALTILGGFGFMGIKYVEYREKWEHGLLWARQYRAGHAEPAHGAGAAGDAGHAAPVAPAPSAAPPAAGAPARPGEERTELPRAAAGPSGLAPAAEAAGHAPRSAPANVQLFFSIYFLMTGLHGLHVLAGMLAIGWILSRALRGEFGPDYFTPVDLVGLYWHLVDLIWIFLFPLLYLIH